MAENELDRLRDWLTTQYRKPWSEGNFTHGMTPEVAYDTALEEVGAQIGLLLSKTGDPRPCAYRGCRLVEDAPIHVRPDERMRPGAHVYRIAS